MTFAGAVVVGTPRSCSVCGDVFCNPDPRQRFCPEHIGKIVPVSEDAPGVDKADEQTITEDKKMAACATCGGELKKNLYGKNKDQCYRCGRGMSPVKKTSNVPARRGAVVKRAARALPVLVEGENAMRTFKGQEDGTMRMVAIIERLIEKTESPIPGAVLENLSQAILNHSAAVRAREERAAAGGEHVR